MTEYQASEMIALFYFLIATLNNRFDHPIISIIFWLGGLAWFITGAIHK